MSSFPFARLDSLSQNIHQEIKPSSDAPLVSRAFVFRSISRKDVGWIVQVLEMNGEGNELVCWEGGYRVGKPLDEFSEKIPDYNAAAFSERVASLIQAGHLHLNGLRISEENTFEIKKLRISDPQKMFKDCVIDLERRLSGVSAIAFEFLANTVDLLSRYSPTACTDNRAPNVLTKPTIRSSPTPELSSALTSLAQFKVLQEELIISRATIARYQQSIAESSSIAASAGASSRLRKPLKRSQQLIAHPHSKRSRILPPPPSSSARTSSSSRSNQQILQPFDTDSSEEIDIKFDDPCSIGSSRKRSLSVKKEENGNLSSAADTALSYLSKASRTLLKADHPGFDSAGSSADDSDTVVRRPGMISNKKLTPSVKRPNFNGAKRTKSMESRKIKPGASDKSCTEDSDTGQTIPTSSLLIPIQTSDSDLLSVVPTSDAVLLSSAEYPPPDSDTDLDI